MTAIRDQIGMCDVCLEALHGPAMSPEEVREHLARCAEEDARAELRREPTPQLELGDSRG